MWVCRLLLSLISELEIDYISPYWLDRFEVILSAILCNIASSAELVKSFYIDIIKIIEEIVNGDKKHKLFQILMKLLNDSFREVYPIESLKTFLLKHAIKKDYYLETLLPVYLEFDYTLLVLII